MRPAEWSLPGFADPGPIYKLARARWGGLRSDPLDRWSITLNPRTAGPQPWLDFR